MKQYLIPFLVSMVPLIELRGAIPIAQGMGLPIVSSYIVCIIGNMIPVPFIYLFAIRKLYDLIEHPVQKRTFDLCQKITLIVSNTPLYLSERSLPSRILR